MRPLIQYDLDEPPVAHSDSLPTGPQPNTHRPPMKKRKRNHHNHLKPLQHWDDPGSTTVGVEYDEQGASIAAGSVPVSYADDIEDEYVEEAADGDEGAAEEQEQEGGEESGPLTHEEIWNDSALIDAWNSAEAEYKVCRVSRPTHTRRSPPSSKAYHGTSKAWKTEPVKKSPLWYNKPYTAPGPSKPKSRSKQVLPQAQAQEDGEAEPDTAPLDFNTYVPTHDPSLVIPSDTTPATQTLSFIPPPSTRMVSRDEAFNNALSAMYWSGYWTAVYHCQSQTSGENNNEPAEATEEDEIEADEGEEDLVPAQR
ncbi:hypothetical protein JVT61DRAFT_9209 [Boletus reticuloceps]|uniref:Uncharacterized protein n=1 Tax=Boletus reticuloceps TaxID=495285 RepID=A0A8I2YGH1_9AGAM|nr:hypothetical protein JVT61DRAFT_9209 [Boletus reticuloceps]